nr:CRISPR-associated protein Cas2 [uncultured Brevundimonas sp.]
MANNLHISYDLYTPGQNYEKVIAKIKTLGSWAKIHKSFWYVDSKFTASEACAQVWAVMDANDKLYVVDATNNNAAWNNLSDEVSEHIKKRWAVKTAA